MEFNKFIKIENKIISSNSPTFIIAEAGVNHGGDMNLAKKLIDLASEAGADAVKFQTFKAKDVISKYAKKYPKREDVAESIVPWIAVRYRLDRISNVDAETILKTIPNRLKFFDEQNFDMHPLVPRE